MKLGRFAAMGAAGALVVSMSACGAGSPGTAAVVDGRRITTTQVSDTTRAYNEVSAQVASRGGNPAAVLPDVVILNALMRGEGADAIARRAGQSVGTQADSLLRGDPDYAPYLADPKVRPLFEALAKADVVARGLGGEEQLDQALQDVPATINPRYGLNGFEQVARNPQTGLPNVRSNSLSNPSSAEG